MALIISIHSPTRGLTSAHRKTFSASYHFNSQPHKGADRYRETNRITLSNFNSQPHKGADAVASPCILPESYFNSQPHKGADPRPSPVPYPVREISIHSPTRGLTAVDVWIAYILIFQFTAPQGG